MECKKVQDRFSSLLEDELDPAEEKILRDHLASCLDCQKDFQRFTKTIRWLHSFEQVEVPEGFLSEIYKKIEERKSKGRLTEENRWQWFRHAFPLKLPVQAVAMVAIVFLVLYLTKMMPVETLRRKDAEPKKPAISTSLSAEKKVARASPKPSPVKPIEKTERSVAKTAPVPAEPQKTEVALAKEGRVSLGARPPLKGIEKDEAPISETAPVSSETGKTETPSAKGARASLATRHPQEILLRSSDLEETLSRLNELLRQFGGKIVTTEGNIFLASVPAVTFSEFERELLGLGSSDKTGEMTVEKNGMERLDVPGGAKPAAPESKRETPAVPEAERKGHILVRIHLLRE